MAKIIKANFGSEEDKNQQEVDDTVSTDGRKQVSLKLSLNDREEAVISDVQRETLIDELNGFPPVYEGDINIVGVYAFDMGKSWEVKAFLRNGLDRPVNFDKVALVIANSEDEVLAAQTFNMQDVGDIPPYSARPYKLNFNKANVYVKKIPRDEWHIAFDNNVGTAVYEDFDYEGLPDSFPKESLSLLNRFLKGLPRIEKGRYDFSKFSIGINENGEIMISIVVRNGLDKPLSIEKLPVTVKNEEGNVVFSGLFEIKDFEVKPGKSKLLILKGMTGVQLNKDMDLSNFNLEFRI